MSTVNYTDKVSIDKVTGYRNVDDSVYRIVKSELINVPYEAGAGADATVTVSVKMKLSTKFGVQVQLHAAEVSQYVTNKTTAGFDIVLTPASGDTLAAGTMDVEVTSFEDYQ